MEKLNESPEAPPTLHLAEEEEEEEAESEEEEQQEEEIPILKAQPQPQPQAIPKRRPGGNRFLDAKKKKRQDDSEAVSVANRGGSPDIVALPPPQLHSVLDNDVSSSSVSSDDNEEPLEEDAEEATDKEEDDEDSVSQDVAQAVSLESFLAGRLSEIAGHSSAGCRQVVKLPRGSAVFYTDKDGKAIIPPNRRTAPPKKSLEPRRIIQSLFAKPKPLKSKKRKGLSKKAKLALAKSKKAAPSKSSTDGRSRNHDANEDSQEEEQDDEETRHKKTQNSEDEGSSEEESQKKTRNDESDDERERSQTHMLRKRRRLYEGNTDGWKKRREEEEEKKSEDEEEPKQRRVGGNEDTVAMDRSEDEDDEEIEYEGPGGWKPMRAAMVAAMELVAKKQVTDDMRNERRIRKYLKPMPPKGKGRRSIFKKMSKPAKSLINDNIPRVVDRLTYEDTLFLSGDILCLKQDLSRGEEVRFYQARGFLKSTHVGESVSVLPLVRIVKQSSKVDAITAVKEFNTRDFKLRFDFGPALLNPEAVELVQRCPHDFYHGHDALFEDPQPGYIYCRATNQFGSR